MTPLLLLVAALLEAGGDALVRAGLHRTGLLMRLGLILVGGLVLLSYGVMVNLPPWDFGKLLGVYVVLFFLAAQAINFFAFGIRPSPGILAGGGLLITGGIVITAWR